MTIREKNIEAIKIKNKKLYENLIKLDGVPSSELEVMIEDAKDGSQIISVVKDDKKTPLNSTYRPRGEAEKFVQKYDELVSGAILVFLGLGNGIVLEELLKKTQEDNAIFIYEPSLEIFLTAIEHFDFSEILKIDGVELFVKGLNDSEIGLYLSANMNHMNVYLTFIESLPKYKELFPREYIELYHIYEDKKRFVFMDINTRIKVRNEFMINPIRNLEYAFHSKSAHDFKKIFNPDMPAILVAAGPSLEKNIEQLKEAKGKAFIFAVDRAAKYLLNHGIEPDMVAAIDYLKPIEFFDDDRMKKIPLVILTDFNHKAMELLDGNDFIYGSTDLKLYRDFFAEFDNTIIGLPQGGSVATYVFALLQYWNFKKIILVGQDLALAGEKHHAGEGTIKREDIKREIIEVPGNVEDVVYTTPDFYAYLRWFEMAVEHYYPSGEVINATEGGAKINGMKVMPLKEALLLYCDGETYDYKKLFERVPYFLTEERYQEAYAYLYEYLLQMNKLKGKLKDAKSAAERAVTLVERKDIAGKEFKKLNQTLDSVFKAYDGTAIAEIISKVSADTEISSIVDLYVGKDDEQEELLRLYKKLKMNYESYYTHIDELIALYEEVMEKIRVKYQLKNCDLS
ncbi:MAG: motility associated factor glycosyltransferase family protein [Lachnospiraceae bacterium]|nr:motility associated factor glycosyltransferase family protein [Lachnospiraceae bacterium]